MFHKAVHKTTVSKDHFGTLDSKRGLAWTLCGQQKYQEAEEMFR
jgi:hypothetical protein